MPRRLLAFSLISFTLIAVTWVQALEGGAEPRVKIDAKILDGFQARNIGPANMGGRIVDLAVVEKNPATYYVAAATGGVWKTTNGGINFTPLMDGHTCSIGAIAVAQSNPDVVWVGSGEANARNSVTWGDGVFKSTDAGKTWTNMGLKTTHHIGRVAIHPTNANIVYVAALGKLWGASKGRGLYKTADAGKTWQNVLPLDENTGCIDVAIDPAEPNIVYAAAYCCRRDGFSAGNPITQTGPLAGLYKSTDGGAKWTRMTKGLPENEYGRCGLSIHRKDPKIVYAVVQTDKTAVTVAGQLPNGKTLDLAKGGVFRSDDKGETWTQVNSACPRPFYYGQIRVDPSDDQRVYVLGVTSYASSDGGKKFDATTKGVHSDHHALWINPSDSKHVILGGDGGLYISKDRATTWTANRGMPLAQFYGVAVDMGKPYKVYGGLQDNGSWGGPSWTKSEEGILLSDWRNILGADGFQCQCDPTDTNIVYAESQYGKPARIDLSKAGKGKGKGGGKAIQPKSPSKDDVYRFNWNSPILLSPHDSKTLFYGGNMLFASDNRGDNWRTISPDLTRGTPGKSSPSTGHTLTTIAESPKKAGLIYVGSDDGRIHVTKDGGKTWTDLSDNVPGVSRVRWISRLECSHHDEATAYLAIDRHRNNDQKPYVFKTTDFGVTWTNITADLPPTASVNVIRESSKNANLLLVGTEQSIFLSLDGGKAWHRFKAGLPIVPIHDLVIHPRERDLVIGTHGRGVYVMDIGPLEEMTAKTLAEPAHLFSVRPAHAFVPVKAETKSKAYVAPNPPVGTTIHYWLKDAAKDASIAIVDSDGKELAKLKGSTGAGLQRVVWNLRPAGEKAELAAPGEYSVLLGVNDKKAMTRPLRVEAD